MEYKRCLTELDEILKYVNEEDLRKIPAEVRESIRQQKDKKYNWEYDKTKSLKEQKINRQTIAMLSYLNMEYMLNKEEKNIMEQIHKFNEKK